MLDGLDSSHHSDPKDVAGRMNILRTVAYERSAGAVLAHALDLRGSHRPGVRPADGEAVSQARRHDAEQDAHALTLVNGDRRSALCWTGPRRSTTAPSAAGRSFTGRGGRGLPSLEPRLGSRHR